MKISTKFTRWSFVNLFAYLLIFYLDGNISSISFDLLEVGIGLENKSALLKYEVSFGANFVKIMIGNF